MLTSYQDRAVNMKTKKLNIAIVSIVMMLVMGLSNVLYNFINRNNELLIRTANVDEIGSLTFEQKTEQIFNAFDAYTVKSDQTRVEFEAYSKVEDLNESKLQFLAYGNKPITKRYRTNLDIENEVFYINTDYIQAGIVIDSEKCETVPFYDRDTDDYYITMPDGSVVSVSEILKTNGIEECAVALSTAAAGVGVAAAVLLLTAVVIAVAPQREVQQTTIYIPTFQWIKVFFGWLRSLWIPKPTTIPHTLVTESITYTLTLTYDDTITKVKAEPFDKTIIYEPKKYFFAIADTTDNLLYVSKVPIDDIAALSIMTTSYYVNSAHKNDIGKDGLQKKFIASIYTYERLDANLIAASASDIMGEYGVTHHEARKSGYFNHYHPGHIEADTSSHPHAFYGLPKA